MKFKRILALMLVILLLFTACGNTSTSGYWESWIKDIPEGVFEKTDSESFELEQDGFSITFTVDKWMPARGTGEYVLHPANNQLPIPKQKPADCVIPFVITTETTTKDSSFTADFNFSVTQSGLPEGESWEQYGLFVQSSEVHGVDLAMFESNKANMEEYLKGFKDPIDSEQQFQYFDDAWRGAGGTHKATKSGDKQIVVGYFIIKDFYAPDYPDGNFNMLPESGAIMFINARFDSPHGNYEEFPITMLEK